MRNSTLASYVFLSKYAKALPATSDEPARRESYAETVDRYLSTFPAMPSPIRAEVRDALTQKRISGSQRGLQFGGIAATQKNARLFNCSSSYCDRPRFFSEAMWLLLCGCGVGFSVSKVHVSKLPSIGKPCGTYTFTVPDTIEGWAEAADRLVSSYFYVGPTPIFDYSMIRPKGSPISHGGVAPGPDGLADSLERCRALLDSCLSRGRLRPIDCFDLVMHLSNAVLSGGIRRSACLTAFDLDDEDMLRAKTGDWFTSNPQRARANISAIVLPHHTEEQFASLFSATREFGEPGFLFLDSEMYITNPCAEIGMCPTYIEFNGEPVSHYSLDLLDPARRADREAEGYTFASGWSFCNLATVNCAAISQGELLRYVRLATILGTYQASLTSFPYLGEVSEKIARRESLLGVSLTGIYSSRDFLNPALLELAADCAVRTNKYHAEELGIAPASRITCVKPEGTASLSLGVVSAGLHPYHAPKYIRRVQATATEPLYQYVERHAPYACEKSVWGNDDLRVISFACTAPEGAITKKDLSVEQHIADIVAVNKHYVRRGEGPQRVEGLHHNVSCTLSVPADKWDVVQSLLWENRAWLTGVSMLPEGGDIIYQQAPLQEIVPDSDDERHVAARILWDNLHQMGDLDLSGAGDLGENEYGAESACAGGACLVPMWSADAPADAPPLSKTARGSIELVISIAEPLLRETPEIHAALADLLRKYL